MLCPSRNRPDSIAELIITWCQTASGRSKLLAAVDDDDPKIQDYRHVENDLAGLSENGDRVEFVYGPRLRLGGTLDALAARYAPDHFAIGFLGDDHRPRTYGWDQAFLDALGRHGTGMVYGNDLLQGRNLPTAIAMTSNIPLALGYFAPPGCTHLFFDNAWLQIGKSLHAITYLDDVVLEHMHPLAGKADADAGYVEVNSAAMYGHDQQAYQEWIRSGSSPPACGACGLSRPSRRCAASWPPKSRPAPGRRSASRPSRTCTRTTRCVVTRGDPATAARHADRRRPGEAVRHPAPAHPLGGPRDAGQRDRGHGHVLADDCGRAPGAGGP